jgi:Ca-activated chloride channel homolog
MSGDYARFPPATRVAATDSARYVGGMRGRHRARGSDGSLARGVVYMVAFGLAVAALVTWRAESGPGCSGDLRLTVAAAPEIATAIRETAGEWAQGVAAPGDACVVVDVDASAPVEVAAAVAAAGGATLDGVETGGRSGRLPDVWVPDSSAWLLRVRAADPGLVPPAAPSVARSPVVIAMPEPVAGTLGWPSTRLSWTSLLGLVSADRNVHIGIVDPTHDAVGLSGLIGFGAAASAAGGAAAEAATIGLMRALLSGRAGTTADLLARFPKAARPAEIAAGLAAAPLSEQALIAYNDSRPAVRLAGIYLTPAPPDLDYPYAVLPGLPTERRELAEAFGRALAGDAFGDRLAVAGLRGADGAGTRAGFTAVPGAPTKAAAPLPAAAVVGRALATWIVVTMPARMLAVIDVSGSMLTPVAAAGGATRGQVSAEAARRGIELFDDSWAVGLWVFSTKLEGDRDYREILPIAPMRTQRAKLQSAIAKVQPIAGGETGLYDTVLAAYQTVQTGWDPKAVNSVVILTDGFNRDGSGLTLGQLVAELQRVRDPKRPIQVIAIGIGDQVSETELRRITTTAGGGTFIARDPSAIGEIFLRAIALRPGTTP